MNRRLLVVGGGIAAIRVIEAARAGGFSGPITMVGDEEHAPYERPPLSKQVLSGEADARIVFPRSDDELDALGVDFRFGRRAASLDRASKSVGLDTGEILEYDVLVIATGARARELAFDMPPGVHVIRTLEDSMAIAEQLRARPRVAIVGAGFVGLEVASTAHGLGCDVTLIESGRVPLVRALGPVMGSNCAALHEGSGVRVRTHGRMLGFTSQERVTGVILEDEILPAELVIVGIGAIPNQEWLEGSGLRLESGVLCDEDGRADASGRIFAVGDVASWLSPQMGAHVRQGHWTSAVEQAAHVGRLIAGQEPGPYRHIPYFWSDQHGIKIQMVGTASVEDELQVLLGSVASGRFVASYFRGKEITAILAFDSPREIAQFRALLARGASRDEVEALSRRLSARYSSVTA